MFPSLLLSLREGLEAALIIGIVLSALNRLGRSHLKLALWQGVGAAILLSLVFGFGLRQMGMQLEGRAEEIFEGIAMLLAAGVLTWMILWMQRQGGQLKQTLERQTTEASQKGRSALFFLAFIAVFREGIELALFLLAVSFTSNGLDIVLGALIGLAAAILLGWLFVSGTQRLSLRGFFQVTNVLLILFAAGLVGLGVHELNEAGIIPGVIEHVYDINFILDDSSELGLLLKALFGYNGNPSLTEIIAYLGYFTILAANFARFWRRFQKQTLLAETRSV